tara:strand:+ start:214 stop:411 length:198 start_codon:yes stop_codon:yes gene_type:complete
MQLSDPTVKELEEPRPVPAGTSAEDENSIPLLIPEYSHESLIRGWLIFSILSTSSVLEYFSKYLS